MGLQTGFTRREAVIINSPSIQCLRCRRVDAVACGGLQGHQRATSTGMCSSKTKEIRRRHSVALETGKQIAVLCSSLKDFENWGSKQTHMENKKTTELLDLLMKLDEDKGDWQTGGKYEQIIAELKTREPFTELLNADFDRSVPSIWEAIDEIREDVKKLKRHKHDDKTGDVMARI